MNTRTWMLIGALLSLPALAEEPLAAKAAPATSAAQATQPVFDLRAARVQDVIRTAAANDSAQQPAAKVTATVIDPAQIPFRAPRRMHRVDCSLADCVAYNADGDALYTFPREQYLGVNGGNAHDEWLSCQSGNDLLSTFERYDKCRGVSIGLPVEVSGVVLKVPLLGR